MKTIMSILKNNLKINSRKKNVACEYLLSILRPADKHSLTNASIKGTLNKSQYCRLLKKTTTSAKLFLEAESQSACLKLVKDGIKPLVEGSNYKVAIIFDSTLQERSSDGCENAQNFNLGSGFISGHKWTNCILYLNNQIIPLPPIKFLTKKECKKLNLNHETEHQKVVESIKNLDLKLWIGDHLPNEVVVLCDAGFDNKRIQKEILEKDWTFIVSLKKSRSLIVKSSDFIRTGSCELIFNMSLS